MGDEPLVSDVDVALVDGEVQLLGNGGRLIARLTGPRANYVRDGLVDMVRQRDDANELDRVNSVLRTAGFEYPAGARGVADLAEHYKAAIERAQQAEGQCRAVLAYLGTIECPNCDHAVSFHDNQLGVCSASSGFALNRGEPCDCDWSSSVAEDIRDLLKEPADV